MMKRFILIHVQVTHHLSLMIFIFHHPLVCCFSDLEVMSFLPQVVAFTTWQYSASLTEITSKSVLVNPCSHLEVNNPFSFTALIIYGPVCSVFISSVISYTSIVQALQQSG